MREAGQLWVRGGNRDLKLHGDHAATLAQNGPRAVTLHRLHDLKLNPPLKIFFARRI
jgi:hypothetical protein